jgi:preprotein translocase subunit SecA
MRDLERMVLLQVIDSKWMDHIDAMDQLRSGIGLRAIGQQDPAAAYAAEGFDMFELMTESIKEDTVKFCFNATVRTSTERKRVTGEGKEVKEEDASRYLGGGGSAPEEYLPDEEAMQAAAEQQERQRGTAQQPFHRAEAKIGRNDPCPCGSGKKYKNCHGKSE